MRVRLDGREEIMVDESKARPDHESDPAHTPGEGWGEEGGASHLGPATSISAGHAVHKERAADPAEDAADESDDVSNARE